MSRIDDLKKRIAALGALGTIDVAATVDSLPIYVLRAGSESAARRVYLSGGMHGDEPAGVEAVLRFLEGPIEAWLDRASFLVLPCMNPTGYAADTRENAAGVDLNRAYGENGCTEVRIVKELLEGQHYNVAIDCHEDYDGQGFYFYEGHRDGPNYGERFIEKVEPIGTIDGDTDPDDEPLSPGVYPISESWGTVGLAPYLLHYNADHVYMGETPTCQWTMDQRARAHLAVIETALELHVKGET